MVPISSLSTLTLPFHLTEASKLGQLHPGFFGNDCGGDAHNGFIVPFSSLNCLLLSNRILRVFFQHESEDGTYWQEACPFEVDNEGQ
jgi:hypothetical protein